MSHTIFSKDSLTTVGTAAAVFGFLIGGVWWAATVQSDLSYVKRDVAEIKAVLMKGNPAVVMK